MATDHQRILILCKTYPSPSSKYVETSCVAGVTENGNLIRLFPVPFRLVEDEQQFKKWQWISARVRRTQDDVRQESHRISVDTIKLLGDPLPARGHWPERRNALESLPVFDSFNALEAARETENISLGLVRPSRLVNMKITPVKNPEWTEEEKAKLLQEQMQGNLFDAEDDQRVLKTLKKLPFDFHYEYECTSSKDVTTHKHKLVDWEAGALYWNVYRKPNWEALFRQKFISDFSQREVLFLMGTIHRFPGQWLIVSVLYLPRLPESLANQASLF